MSPEQHPPASSSDVEPPTSQETTGTDTTDLERMLGEARVAQAATDQVAQDNQAQAAAIAEASLMSSLEERDSILERRREADQERSEASDLLARGIDLRESSESVAPETEAFIEMAGGTVEEREEELKQLTERLVTLDADPAVRNFLYQEALEEGRRIQVRRDYESCYYIKTEDGQHRGTMHEVLRQVSPESSAISGTHIGDDPLCRLEMFTFQASGLSSGSEPGELAEAEDAAKRMVDIKTEIESGHPDLQKVDGLLAEFLSKRIEHFVATLDQRVEERARALMDYYRDHPEDAEKYNPPTTMEDWKRQINDSIRGVDGLRSLAAEVMQGEGLKAKRLARISYDIFQRSCGVGGDPCIPDNYSTPNDDKLAA